MIDLEYQLIKKFCYLYIMLPVICFLLFYMNSVMGLFFTFIFGAVAFRTLRKSCSIKSTCTLNLYYIIVLAVIAIFWSILGGQGNLYYQSLDWNCRNAIFRDLIYRSWPVVYEKYDKAMVYYVAYWLPCASLVKGIGYFIPAIYDSDMAFHIGNIFLLFWTSCGVFLVELLLVSYAKPKSFQRLLLIPVIMIFFSGLDIIGVIRDVVTEGKTFHDIHIEWWSEKLQFSSLTTCLFWVFNQAIIPWIAILCILQEETIDSYVFIGICTFASAPIPFVGLVVYMLINALKVGVESFINQNGKLFLKQIFSIQNIMCLLIIPIFLLFFQSNTSVNTGVNNSTMDSITFFSLNLLDLEIIQEILLFILLEIGIYLLLLYFDFRSDIFYYITAGTAIISPLFSIGTGQDFVMRFSIPTIMVTAAMCIKILVNYDKNKTGKRGRICCVLLCICLIIGSVTPLTEFFRGYNAMLQNGKIANVYDEVKTFDQELVDYNFVTYDYQNQVFFRYLAPVDNSDK